MDYKKFEKNEKEILEKFTNKETFYLLVSSTWCPDCNVLKFGTEEVSDQEGMLKEFIDDNYVIFNEVTELENRNIDLIPLMVHIQDITKVNYRDISWGFDEESNKYVKTPNIDSFRPPIPFIMKVVKGKPVYIQASFENKSVFETLSKK